MIVILCIPHPVAVSDFIKCSGLCACTEKNKNCLFRNYTLCSVHVYGKKYICINTILETELWLTAAGIRIPCIT